MKYFSSGLHTGTLLSRHQKTDHGLMMLQFQFKRKNIPCTQMTMTVLYRQYEPMRGQYCMPTSRKTRERTAGSCQAEMCTQIN